MMSTFAARTVAAVAVPGALLAVAAPAASASPVTPTSPASQGSSPVAGVDVPASTIGGVATPSVPSNAFDASSLPDLNGVGGGQSIAF